SEFVTIRGLQRTTPLRSVLRYARETRESLRSRRHSRRVQRGGVLPRFDDFDVAGAAANVAAERIADFGVGRARIAPQQSRRRHDEARRAIAALRAELFVEAALHGGEVPIGPERVDGVAPAAVDGGGERQARQPRRIVY